jgi:hypothetical protein
MENRMRQPGLAAIVVLLLAGCSSSSPSPPPSAPEQPAETNSASLAIVTVGKQLKAYIPEESYGADLHARLQVVDAGAAKNGASGHLGVVDLGEARGRADAVAAADGLVIAIGVTYPVIWFIDPATDQVTTRLDLPDTYPAWRVSGRDAYMSGVIIDAPRRRAYASVWNGFIVLDLDTRTIVDEILAAPAENFAFDPQRNRLVAPFYLCPQPLPPEIPTGTPPPCGSYVAPDGTVITEGLNVVDLSTKKVFTFVDPAAPDQSAPVGLEPDATALDITGNRVLVAAESTPWLKVVDLATATFEPGVGASPGTFTASSVTLTTPVSLTEVAIEPGSRLGIGMEDGGAFIRPFDLPGLTADAAIITTSLPDLPWGAGPWQGHGDPHGVRTGVLDGKPVAWLTNLDHTWLARVDLSRFNEVFNASPNGPSAEEMAKVVTYIYMYPAP